jgi:hypothetical protein
VESFKLDIAKVSSKLTYGTYHPTCNQENATHAVKSSEVGTTGSIHSVKRDFAHVKKQVLRTMHK